MISLMSSLTSSLMSQNLEANYMLKKTKNMSVSLRAQSIKHQAYQISQENVFIARHCFCITIFVLSGSTMSI